MISPVHFMTLEEELQPVAKFLHGSVLNAGCGNRDISPMLLQWNATRVDNCDIATTLSNAFSCDLSAIPKPDGSYDSILCNAVLEHVRDPRAVMCEFYRLLVPSGRAVLSVPFLQPFHPCPTDFQRYTVQGLEELCHSAGFEIIEMQPLHSVAQTLGWILWEHVQTKGQRALQYAVWLPIYVATRLWQKPSNIIHTANTLQVVVKKV